jgi:hypothetical protein
VKEQRGHLDVYERCDASRKQFDIQLPRLYLGHEEHNTEHLRKCDTALKGLRTLKGHLLAEMAPTCYV